MNAVPVLPLLAALSFASPMASPTPTSLLPALDSVDQILLANRLRGYRFNVRPSRYRRGAFSRGDCPVDAQEQLQAIVPDWEKIDDMNSETGREAAEHPGNGDATTESSTILNPPIPAYQNAATHPVFLLQAPALDGGFGELFVETPTLPLTERQQYKVEFDLTDQAGIIGIRIPPSAPELQGGQVYRWRVSIECSPEDDNYDVIVFNSAVYEQVADIDGDDGARFEYYLNQGIWQDAAAMLAEAHYTNPDAQTDEDWATFMDISGTPQFANVPIVSIQTGRLE